MVVVGAGRGAVVMVRAGGGLSGGAGAVTAAVVGAGGSAMVVLGARGGLRGGSGLVTAAPAVAAARGWGVVVVILGGGGRRGGVGGIVLIRLDDGTGESNFLYDVSWRIEVRKLGTRTILSLCTCKSPRSRWA